MYLIDTNIFLEILLEQEKAEDCSLFLQKVRNGNIKAVVSTFSIHSISVILSSLGKFTELEEFLSDIEYFKGLSEFFRYVFKFYYCLVHFLIFFLHFFFCLILINPALIKFFPQHLPVFFTLP